MKLFNILLVWSSALILQVLSDNNAICYELLYYYYVYKMEFAASLDASGELKEGFERTIAVGCAEIYDGRMCYFDEFTKHIIEPDWAKVYRPTAADHTITPDESVFTSLKAQIPPSASYNLQLLSTKIPEVIPMPKVFEKILSSANAALDAGGVENVDLEEAIAYAKAARVERASVIFRFQLAALDSILPEEAQKLVYNTGSEFNWDETLQNIDEAVDAGQFSLETGAAYKETIRSFSLTFEDGSLATDEAQAMHFAIVRSISSTINQLRQAVVDDSSSSESSSSPRAPSPVCDDEFTIEFG
jgi:hypothetical protein